MFLLKFHKIFIISIKYYINENIYTAFSFKILMIIKVLVEKGSKEIIERDNLYIVYTKEKFENNKANIDVMKKIAKYFKKDISDVKIIRGSKSRNKIIEIK